jgi:glutathione S-transferase
MLAIVKKWLAWLASSWSGMFRQIRMFLAGLLSAKAGSSRANLSRVDRRLDRA